MCGGLSVTRLRRLPRMGSEGRLGGDLSPGTNPFIFLLRYSAAKVTAENRNEQRSHGRLLSQAARNMVIQEDAILHSEDSLRKMSIITTHLQYQQEAIQKNVEHSKNLQDQLKHLMKQ
uniref:BLOC-1-related complex subunit 7 n=1 Tax=Cyprinus carpio TaxID=7962 RepID=A0A8C2A5H0_CYPCA